LSRAFLIYSKAHKENNQNNSMEMETAGRRRKITKLIDIEWVKSLIRLSMKVPDNWWTPVAMVESYMMVR